MSGARKKRRLYVLLALTLLLAAFSLAAPALTPNDPNATDAARIKDIVISETDYTAQQIKIMEAN